MLVTLIPLFDENMSVRAYSLFSQKNNFLLNPSMLGTGQNDGAAKVEGLEVIRNMGIETLPSDKEVFVTLNNISVFSDIDAQCDAPHGRIVLLIDDTFPPVEMYTGRLKELKDNGYKLAIRKLAVHNFEDYRDILKLMDYIFINYKKIPLDKAKLYFNKVYPALKLCAGNIESQEVFEEVKALTGYDLFEGEFFRVPVTKGQNKVAPLKVNYIELLNTVNNNNFELAEAADIIGRDPALAISLLKMVNRMTINSQITSLRHATAMLGQKELKKWINTAVVHEMYSERPSEMTRLSLIRAKFAENLAPVFGQEVQAQELFLVGLFSVLDVIMEKSMSEALKVIKVSKNISDALIDRQGNMALVLDFMLRYESADWQEVSRQMILQKIDVGPVYEAYMGALLWYRKISLDE
ncbi:EAL and HDOD domain-containing protein [Kineothrix sp. MB12-C1]|uniref:EAL and HDOD domain-containing protein n=1 Tax=Kineothrix sp. MB12-C1 TaxID=3070215 RepID=UPI0027D2D023|nr:HDOD domain-containing protein [Kineothrix sp. MB12-C1]WMC91177.1 HDOD domain-containing protein [Kineothrix sp. MB12-C1]